MPMEKRGGLHVSKFQKNARQPKYVGSALIEGKSYRLKAWKKINDRGEPWISILFEDASKPEEKPIPLKTHNYVYDDDDDIPF
jgi:hypothetical protein